jgi:hypothetical protein
MKQLKPHTKMVCKVLTGGLDPWFGIDTRTGARRKRWWTKARIPGTVRPSRMPGGSGYRGDKLWEG